MIGQVEVCETAEATAARVADWLIERAVAAQAPVRIALSGGSTPKLLFALLNDGDRRRRMPWSKLHLFWGDERYVSYDSDDSNYGVAKRLLLDHVDVPPGQIHPFPVTEAPEIAAARYADLLAREYGAATLDPVRPLFEVNLLGLGDDGHTASLIPGQPVLRERDKWVAAVGQGRPEVRLTLTYPALESAAHVAFMVTGAGKAGILAQLRTGTADVPAAHVHPVGRTLWFVDRAAWPVG